MPAYVGYMYGTPNATTFTDVHTNTTSSNIKNIIDNWYSTYLINYNNYISYTSTFCGDRTLYQGNGIENDNWTFFNAYKKFNEKNATFTCPNEENDLYTTKQSNIGNKALIYPIALLTYDELMFAA